MTLSKTRFLKKQLIDGACNHKSMNPRIRIRSERYVPSQGFKTKEVEITVLIEV
jgi:hypothetical protein